MKVIKLLLLVFIACVQLPAFSADDYLDEIDFVKYWDEPRNITVWVQPNKYQDIAYDAFRVWMNAANGCVKFVDSNSSKTANIKVLFSDTTRIIGEGNAVGVTQYGIRTQTIIVATKMKSRIDIEVILLHEIGHALGIVGHPNERKSIMSIASAAGRKLTNRDAATIRRMYCGR